MFVYRLTNTVNGKIYIGKTVDLTARLYMHSKAYDKATALHRAIKKYGFASFVVDVLERDVSDDVTLNCREIYWITSLRSNDRSIGYNLTSGGEGMSGWKATPETRLKWSKLRKGKRPPQHVLDALHAGARKPKSEETRRKMSEAAKLRYRDPSNRKLMSDALKGRTFSDEHRAKISASKRARDEERRNASV